MKERLKGIIVGAIIGVLASHFSAPMSALAARTTSFVLSGFSFSSQLAINLPAPTGMSLGNSTTTGSVYSNGGSSMYFLVTALDGAGGESLVSTSLGTSTVDQAHGWQISWNKVQGAAGYRVYFSTSTPQSLTQYFNATSTNTYYTFTSTSSPVFVPAGAPTTNSAFAVNIQANGNSWLNGGNVIVGTTTPGNADLTVFGGINGPNVALMDSTTTNEWVLRAISNSLFIATSTASATSSVSAFSIDPNGAATFSRTVTATGFIAASPSNTATTTTQVGCIQTTATSTQTPIRLVIGTSGATTSYQGNQANGVVAWQYGKCPI